MAQAGAQARPAELLLASSLIGDEELEVLLEGVVAGRVGPQQKRRGESLGTGVKSLDEALDGGLEGGRVVCVSAGQGGGGVELCLTFLTNCLLQAPTSTAAIIDTTGNLDILRIYTLIVSRLQADSSLLNSLRGTSSLEGVSTENVAAKVLDRVKIMRVFDFVGVMEAVSEIRDGLEGRRPPAEKDEIESVKKIEKEDEAPPQPPRRTVIADSEDEEDDDEMLFDNEAAALAQSVALPASQPNVQPQLPDPAHEDEQERGLEEKISFILIDNLAHIINPLLKKDHVQGHALSTSFLLTLSHLTRTHALYTILFNPTSPPRPPPPNTSNQPAPPHQQQQQPPQSPSIFSSNKVVPALGNVLSPYLDLHLLVSRMPRRKADARAVYADGGAGIEGVRGLRHQSVKTVDVVEVVGDRWSGRVGAWGAFAEGEKGMRDV
ncbi:hypothetical protein BU26DRAFT_312056 [Trematosphaeria pertusa]|uniref:DNA recombination and repair protein Rad51-like C-terminal domain-containing protein n=1 Tax=Trematosphaeria pertusa TaxID=390896 RepID=A0A6A6IFX4_9PLEO|nr:uncharacterized protein BU26DRAFT_312056 [Trematosphaeria pertusa]KAF2249099.1 hypothetical protein BU26DRAFT_312056 [Trematosphaeria pertusa]